MLQADQNEKEIWETVLIGGSYEFSGRKADGGF